MIEYYIFYLNIISYHLNYNSHLMFLEDLNCNIKYKNKEKKNYKRREETKKAKRNKNCAIIKPSLY